MPTDKELEIDGLPSAFIIGAMRSGTTSLYNMLSFHPDVCMSSVKEPCFFVNDETGKGNWKKGVDWYTGLFPISGGMRIEASTLYTRFPYHPGVPERIYSMVPNARFIYIIRNPVDRAISQYAHSVLKGIERRPINVALAPSSSSSYVLTGLYYLQISLYLAMFDPRQFYVTTSEMTWSEPVVVLEQISQFLGIRSWLPGQSYKTQYNSSFDLAEKVRRGKRKIENSEQESFVRGLENMAEVDQLSSWKIAEHLGFDSQKRASLGRCFVEDRRSLERFLKRKLVEWD